MLNVNHDGHRSSGFGRIQSVNESAPRPSHRRIKRSKGRYASHSVTSIPSSDGDNRDVVDAIIRDCAQQDRAVVISRLLLLSSFALMFFTAMFVFCCKGV